MKKFSLYPLALLSGLLPLLTIHLCYLVAASYGRVPWCIPYIDSCTSISATGRHIPEYYLFKALMIPSAILIAMYWWYCCQWLRKLQSYCATALNSVLIFGITASLGLIIYTLALGSIGEHYQLQRRIGVTLFFGLTFLAQLIMAYVIGHIDVIYRYGLRYLFILRGLALVTLGIGIASVCLSLFDRQLYKQTDDAFEWGLTLLLCLQPLIVALLWKQSRRLKNTAIP